MEEIQPYLNLVEKKMDRSIQHVLAEIAKIRAGKSMPNMLDDILVSYYDTPTPLNQVSSITTPDSRTLLIKPWEKTIIKKIEKAIMDSSFDFTPQNDGEQIIINIPAPTEERRKQLVKQVKNEGELGKISLRNLRHDFLHEIKNLKDTNISEDLLKQAEEEVQLILNACSKKIEKLISQKEEEIMKV